MFVEGVGFICHDLVDFGTELFVQTGVFSEGRSCPVYTFCHSSLRGPGGDFLYRRMVSEARGDLFVKATCLENSDQSLTLF